MIFCCLLPARHTWDGRDVCVVVRQISRIATTSLSLCVCVCVCVCADTLGQRDALFASSVFRSSSYHAVLLRRLALLAAMYEYSVCVLFMWCSCSFERLDNKKSQKSHVRVCVKGNDMAWHIGCIYTDIYTAVLKCQENTLHTLCCCRKFEVWYCWNWTVLLILCSSNE